MNRNVTATILLVLAIGVYFTFTQAKLAEVNAVRVVNQEYVSALDNADELVKVRDAVQNQYKNIAETDRTKLDKMLPNTVDNIRLTIDMDNLARTQGMAIKNLKAIASSATQKQGSAAPSAIPTGNASVQNGTIPTPTLDTVTISFGVTATYQQFIDYLKALESNLRIMDLTHLSVTANANGTYDYGVELKTYWLRQQ